MVIDFLTSKHRLGNATDSALLAQVNEGKEAALAEMYNRYWEPLFLYAVKVLRDADEASDVVQETFIALWQKRGALSEIVSLKAYLFAIVRYKSLRKSNLILSEERNRESLLKFINEYDSSPELHLMASEMEAFLEERIQQLPDRMREVFLLSRREHLSYAEIAERLNISDKTVKKQIHNALKYLRSTLDEQHLWTTVLFCTALTG